MGDHRAPARRTGAVRRLGDALLWLGAAAGAACLLGALAAVLLGWRPLVFQSGSMAPAMPTGTLAFAVEVPAAEVAVGDVVAVRRTDGSRLTHRVVDVRPGERAEQRVLTLRGDANPAPDQDGYVVDRVDRVVWDVPLAGRVVERLAGPLGMLVAGAALAAGLLVRRPPRPPALAGGAALALAGAVALGALPAVPAPSGTGLGTLAAFTDTGTVASGPVATGAVPAPVITGCEIVTGGALGTTRVARVTFTAVTSPRPLTYAAVRTDTGASLPITDLGNGSRRADLTLGVLGSLLSSYTVRITAALPAPSAAWTSAPSEQRISATLTMVTCGSLETVPPTVGFTAPTNGHTGDAGAFQGVARSACGSNRPACGTVSDASGVASVSYQLKRVMDTGTEYFHASTAVGGIWDGDSAFEVAAVSGGRWEVDGLITTAWFDHNRPMAYTLTVRATDNAGNTTTASITFTLS